VIGDSYSEAILSAVVEAASSRNNQVLYYGGAHGCAVIAGYERDSPVYKCQQYYREMKDFIAQYPGVDVLLIQAGHHIERKEFSDDERSELLNNIKASLSTISHDRRLFVLEPIPRPEENVPKYLAGTLETEGLKTDYKARRSLIEDQFIEYKKALKDAADGDESISYIKVINALCDDEYCRFSYKGRPMYYDRGHLSEFGNKYLVDSFRPIFD